MAASRFLFDQAPEKDIVTWSALISGYVQNGQPNGALRVFLEMESMNVKPDEFILASLMSASSQLEIERLLIYSINILINRAPLPQSLRPGWKAPKRDTESWALGSSGRARVSDA
ncbi:hypothetical protein PIB30_103746 [Stylosanthes scabra]|uniref:Pentatricopeptide repeat-containing protein n=1 Tax=Stylosanthes scabra TaxID=79078 RepID=A0ABU6RYW4_9FABA|nr:hypothetical protein [Stylosanthes scabra]